MAVMEVCGGPLIALLGAGR